LLILWLVLYHSPGHFFAGAEHKNYSLVGNGVIKPISGAKMQTQFEHAIAYKLAVAEIPKFCLPQPLDYHRINIIVTGAYFFQPLGKNAVHLYYEIHFMAIQKRNMLGLFFIKYTKFLEATQIFGNLF
jgi:hypothetical protein